MIGTHYDADHLEGLVPIIEDSTIEIGEAWMPPVANDTEISPSDASIQDHHLLAFQFSQEDADKKLFEYLKSKEGVCQEVSHFLQEASRLMDDYFLYKNNKQDSHTNRSFFKDINQLHQQGLELTDYENLFKQHIHESESIIGHSDCSHADAEFDDGIDFLTDEINSRGYWYNDKMYSRSSRQEYFSGVWKDSKNFVESDMLSLSYIRRSAAKDAINATSLYKVVQALKQRNIPIAWHAIPDGKPHRFIWNDANKKFIPRAYLISDGPELTLLGPSEGLVKKHQKRLPIGQYMMHLAYRSIPIKNITPSNQLSYVILFQYKNQGILITGDAGFVDFKPRRKSFYYEDILNKLTPLHLIQVAHHGGRNAHFYNALLASSYPAQKEKSLLLLSHATHDKFRPSKEFGLFVENLLKDGDDISYFLQVSPA